MIRAHVDGPSILVAALLLTSLPPQVAGAAPLLSPVDQQSDIATLEPLGVVLSPEDRHVYLVGDASLTVLERDPMTGSTSFLESHFDGRRGVGGLRHASSLAMTGDGRFLYSASPFHPGADGVERTAVAIFERDVTTGTLRFEAVHTEDFEGDGLPYPSTSVALSSNDAHLYVASSSNEAVLAFERNPATGRLSFLATIDRGFRGVPGHSSLSFGPEGRFLYMTNLERGSITVFEREPVSGLLSFVQDLMSDDPDYERVFPVFPISVAVSPGGLFAYVTNLSIFPFDDAVGSIVSFRRNPATGRLRRPREDAILPVPYQMAISSDGAFLYASGEGDPYFFEPSGIGVYARDAATGALEDLGFQVEDPAFDDLPSATRALAMSGDGRHVYVGALNGRPLETFERRANTGLLEPVTAPTEGVLGLQGAARAAVSPDGRHVYVASPASDSLSVFEHRQDGGLDFVEAHRSLSRSTTVAVSTDGRWVYGLDDVFARDDVTGKLELVGHPPIFAGYKTVDVAPSPDGRHVYMATGRFQFRALRVFAQSRSTGRLVERTLELEAVPGLGRLKDSTSVAVSPDGAFVYALGIFERSAGAADDAAAVWVLARDASTGDLQLELFRTLGPTDLSGAPPRLALSGDGEHLYVIRPGEDDLQVLHHNRRRATLGRVERLVDGAGGVEGLDEPNDVAVSPSGHLVYVASRGNDAVTMFSRDPGTGELAYVETVGESPSGVEGLFRVEGLAVSPDNRHVYAVSPRLSSISALTLDCREGSDVFCAFGGRFRVDVAWRDGLGQSGTARLAPPRTPTAGLFWFFSPDNWEMLVKVLDGCSVNSHVWVFAAATTNVETTLRVTDTATGELRRYFKAQGIASPAVTDTTAFASSCP